MNKGNFRIRYLNKFKKIDIFGYPISMTYKNEPDFRSVIGALVTLLVFFGIGIYSLLLITDLIKYNNYTITNVQMQFGSDD